MECFCRKIQLSSAVTRNVLDLVPEVMSVLEIGLPPLNQETRELWLSKVKKALGKDDNGFRMLTLMLLYCKNTWDLYQQLGISKEIFLSTMGCFSRFVGEHKGSYGFEAFDREWWTVRQISGSLFRIGTLEYELVSDEIQIHIPSDADLTRSALRDSYDSARKLIRRTFPDYQNAPMKCESWLLSPQLKRFLPENSRILAFQSAFSVTDVEDSDDIRTWVFKNPTLSNDALPENTSLQQNLKNFLLQGGIFQNGKGLLTEPAFQT